MLKGIQEGIWSVYLKKTENMEDTCMDACTILKWILNKWDERTWAGLI
jgi:hypothetical protein